MENKIWNINNFNKNKTKIDNNGVRRMIENDIKTPSPSRLLMMLNMWIQTEIPKHMIFRTIKQALEKHDENYKLLEKWGVASWKRPISPEKSNILSSIIYEKLSTTQRKDIFLTQYGKRGSEVHAGIETFLETGMVITYENSDVNNRLIAFINWYNNSNNFTCLETELFVYDKNLKTKGILDSVMVDSDGHLWIIDFKTNAEIKEDYIAIQLIHYKKALESWNIKVDKLGILQLAKNGKVNFHELQETMFPVYEKIHQNLLDIFRYGDFINKRKGK